MALGSPGVQVTVIDESFYTPAAPGTIPLVFVATEENKTNPSGGTAQGTTKDNFNKLWLITSQRDLTDTFGTPKFYTDNNGDSLNGSELNEYGLQAAYSLLGVTSRAYIARADVNLAQLKGTTSAPTGDPASGTYWVDTAASKFGVFEWDNTGNNGKGVFVAKTPLIVDDENFKTAADMSLVPLSSFGNKGDYAMVVTSDNENKLYFKKADNTWEAVANGFDSGKEVVISPHTSYPTYTTSTVNQSVWVKTTSPGKGASWGIKLYNGATKSWGSVSAPIYSSTRQALEKMDYTGGGQNIPVGTLFIESNYEHSTDAEANFKIWRRNAIGPTVVISPASTATTIAVTSFFQIRETLASTNNWSAFKTVELNNTNNQSVASAIPAGISAAGLTNVEASYDAVTKKVTLTHKLGGEFQLLDDTGTPLAVLGLTAYNVFTKTGTQNLYAAPINDGFEFVATNWKPLVFEAKASAPFTDPADGTLWYDVNLTDVDIMVHDGSKWVGYRNQFSATDPMGPLVQALEPVDGDRSDGGNLVTGDIWISTSSADDYGKKVYIYDEVTSKWELQNLGDNSSPDGWVFDNARWSTSGADKAPGEIEELLLSNYVDPDCPDPALYPRGIKLWNLRRSGFTVKKYVANAIDITANEGENIRLTGPNRSMNDYETGRWTCVTPNNEDGSGSFGRFAQRKFVVKELKAFVDTDTTIRDTETVNFNLMACPGYPELMSNMVTLNVDRGQTAFIVGDTPFRLTPNATELSNWGNNIALAVDNGDEGLVTSDEYLGVFYPSGSTTDNSGNRIVVPSSHMMLRTIINSDAKSYQWFAPAGLRRGGVDNATSVGYINAEGEFQTASLYEGLRDVMSTVKINPIATIPGVGLVNHGQYTRARTASAMDRINVVRLVAYLRRQLSILAKPFLFEPNDAQTRREIKQAAESLLIELVGQRALYDFIVVCDTTNNTPARIDRSELYMDIAIEPVKAVEFIYIPLRIKNTGEIRAGT